MIKITNVTRKITVQSIKEDQRRIRKTCCQWIRKNTNLSKLETLMCTEVKICTKNGYFNSKNDVIWADSRSDVNKRGGLHSMEKCPVCVMVAVGVTCSGRKRPYLFLKDTRLNDQSYHNQWLPLYIEEGERLF